MPIAQEASSGSTVARAADTFEVHDRAQRAKVTARIVQLRRVGRGDLLYFLTPQKLQRWGRHVQVAQPSTHPYEGGCRGDRSGPSLRAPGTPTLAISTIRVPDSGRFDLGQLAADGFCFLTARSWARRKNRKGRRSWQSRTFRLTTRICDLG